MLFSSRIQHSNKSELIKNLEELSLTPTGYLT